MWDTVPCSQQNGPITGYKLFYNDTNSNMVSVDINLGNNHRLYNIQGLTPSTRYIIAVAAVNDGGTGPYSDPPLTVWTLSDTGTGDELKCVAILKYIFTTKSAATTSTFICRYYWPYWNWCRTCNNNYVVYHLYCHSHYYSSGSSCDKTVS